MGIKALDFRNDGEAPKTRVERNVGDGLNGLLGVKEEVSGKAELGVK